MVRQTEPDKPVIPPIPEGPLEGVTLPTKPVLDTPHVGGVQVQPVEPTLLQKLSTWWKRVA